MSNVVLSISGNFYRSKLSMGIFLISSSFAPRWSKSLIFIWISPFHLAHCQVLTPPVISRSPVSSNSFCRSGLELYFAAFTRNSISTLRFSQSRTIPRNVCPNLQTLCPYNDPFSSGKGAQFSNFPRDSEPSGNFWAYNDKICIFYTIFTTK